MRVGSVLTEEVERERGGKPESTRVHRSEFIARVCRAVLIGAIKVNTVLVD